MTTQAALVGTKGMQAVIDDNTAIYVVDQRPSAEKNYPASFRFDPNSIPMASGDNYVILQGYRSDGVNMLQVYHYYSTSTGHRIKVQMRLDDDTWSSTSYYTITDAPHTIEIEWQASTGASNGSLTLKIDGAVQETLTGKDTDQQNVDYVRLGAVAGIDAGTRGTVYFDDFYARDYITPLVSSFVYDGDSNRIKSTIGITTTVYIGNYFEWNVLTGTMTKYYYAGSTRIAMRVGNTTGEAGLTYILGDHLGSSSVFVNPDGSTLGGLTYKPWGEVRLSTGTIPTRYRYTGQYTYRSEFGLYYYGARWYDPYITRWAQPDTIVPDPGNVLDYDRYSYVRNNPLRYTDPTGHTPDGTECNKIESSDGKTACQAHYNYYIKLKVPEPDKVCLALTECVAAYQTYQALAYLLGYIPSPEQVLYMTAQAEYYGYTDSSSFTWHGWSGTLRGNTQEALARSYYEPYEACMSGSWTCSESKLYMFLSGYQPWFGSNLSATTRAAYLKKNLSSDTLRQNLEDDITQILDPNYASSQGWTVGMVGSEPWQWHNYWREPNEGEALGWVYAPNPYGNYWWVLTADQTDNFHKNIKPQNK